MSLLLLSRELDHLVCQFAHLVVVKARHNIQVVVRIQSECIDAVTPGYGVEVFLLRAEYLHPTAIADVNVPVTISRHGVREIEATPLQATREMGKSAKLAQRVSGRVGFQDNADGPPNGVNVSCPIHGYGNVSIRTARGNIIIQDWRVVEMNLVLGGKRGKIECFRKDQLGGSIRPEAQDVARVVRGRQTAVRHKGNPTDRTGRVPARVGVSQSGVVALGGQAVNHPIVRNVQGPMRSHSHTQYGGTRADIDQAQEFSGGVEDINTTIVPISDIDVPVPIQSDVRRVLEHPRPRALRTEGKPLLWGAPVGEDNPST